MILQRELIKETERNGGFLEDRSRMAFAPKSDRIGQFRPPGSKFLLIRFPLLGITPYIVFDRAHSETACTARIRRPVRPSRFIKRSVGAGALVKRFTSARLVMQTITMLLGAPAIVWMGMAHSPWAVSTAMAVFGLFRGLYEAISRPGRPRARLRTLQPRLRHWGPRGRRGAALLLQAGSYHRRGNRNRVASAAPLRT